MNTERVFILIDGSNFYHRVRECELKKLLTFDFKAFANWLGGKRIIARQKYYIGVVRARNKTDKEQKLRRDQQRLFSKLRECGWDIGYGFLLEWGRSFHEKGVDVQMAVDILVGTYENLYDTIVIVSSDTDLIPALQKARKKGKKIEYVGFAHRASFALKANTDSYVLLTKEDIKKFLR